MSTSASVRKLKTNNLTSSASVRELKTTHPISVSKGQKIGFPQPNSSADVPYDSYMSDFLSKYTGTIHCFNWGTISFEDIDIILGGQS